MARELYSNYCLNKRPLANGYYCVTMMGREKYFWPWELASDKVRLGEVWSQGIIV